MDGAGATPLEAGKSQPAMEHKDVPDRSGLDTQRQSGEKEHTRNSNPTTDGTIDCSLQSDCLGRTVTAQRIH